MIAFGGASLSSEGGGYGFGKIDDAEGLIRYAIERDITVFDTAPIYGFNQSEITLGKALKRNRDKVEIVSKGGISWHSSKRVNMSNDPKIIQGMLESSLRHLQTDYIDYYMIHWPDSKIDIRFALEVLAKAKNSQKILKIGLCNTNTDELTKASEVCDIELVQSEFNFFYNAFEDLEFKGKKMGWGTFDKGILAGTVTLDRKFSSEDCRSWAPWWKKSNWKDRVRKIEPFKKNIKALSLQYSLKYMDYSLCGFKTRAQIDEAIELSQDVISEEELLSVKKHFYEKS